MTEARQRLLRVRRIQTVAVIVVSAVVAFATVTVFGRARDARSAWSGESIAFAVRHDVARGEELTPDDLVQVALPAALTPDNAITGVTTGVRVRIDIAARTIVVATMLDDRPDYPASWRVVAVPPGVATPPVQPGDLVDLVSGVDVLVERAIVASVSPLAVAVPADRAPAVATALHIGEFILLTH